jgi:hypothetical protein
MAKVNRTKGSSAITAAQYTQHGWKKIHSSSTGSFYTSTMPAHIKNSMIEANKQQRVLSTGTVVVHFLSKEDGKVEIDPLNAKRK